MRLCGETGALTVAFLGVGSAFSNTRHQSNILVIKGDAHLMIDMGSHASLSLREAGLSPVDIDVLAPTHSHADHVGGVEEWCLRKKYGSRPGGPVGDSRPTLVASSEYARILWEATLRGGLEFAKTEDGTIRRVSLEHYVGLAACAPVAGRRRPSYRAVVGDGVSALAVELMRTHHIASGPFESSNSFYSVGALVDDRVLITGDTAFDPDLLEEFGEGVDVIFHDCQAERGGVHTAYEELATLPQDLKKKMFLYHLPDGIESRFSPEADGFAGWAQDFRAGVYVFR